MAGAALFAAVFAGCATGGGVRYVQPAGATLVSTAAPLTVSDYLLNVGDEVQIDLLWHPELTSTQVVRQDGKITAVGLGEVVAAGRSTSQVDSAVTELAAHQYRSPQVTVLLRRGAELVFYVAGEGRISGPQKWVPGMRAVQALGVAGGMTDTGQLGTVLLIKRQGPDGEPIAYRLNMKQALASGGRTNNPAVDPYDILWIPRSPLASAALKMSQIFQTLVTPANLYLKGWEIARSGATHTFQEGHTVVIDTTYVIQAAPAASGGVR